MENLQIRTTLRVSGWDVVPIVAARRVWRLICCLALVSAILCPAIVSASAHEEQAGAKHVRRAAGDSAHRQSRPATSARSAKRPVTNDLWTVSGLKREIAARHARALRLRKAGHQLDVDEATDWLDARLWYIEQRAFPNDTVDWSKWQRAAKHRDQMPAADFRRGIAPNFIGADWSFVGPADISRPYQQYFGPSPIAGRINAVAFDPVDSNTYWAGGPGGLFKTTDAGVSWRNVSDNFPVISISSIAVHPTNPDIVFAGTGDFDGAAPYGCGIMKTTNGGLTWTNMLGGSIGTAAISAIVIDPDNPNIVNICSGRGGARGFVYRSTDGGTTWQIRSTVNAAWSDMEVSLPDSAGNRTYYLTGLSDTGSFLISKDRGATWTAGTPPFTQPNQNSLEVAASPVFPNRVFLLSGTDRKIWVSDSFGAPPWSEFTSGIPSSDGDDPLYNWSQNSYDVHLTASHDGDTEMVYAGLITLARADIKNGTWKWVNVGNTYGSGAKTHNDQHCMAIHPSDPNLMLIGNDGGVYRLIYNPANKTTSFTSLNKNLPLTQFYHIAVHPSDPTKMIGGAQDNASPASTGNLADWGNPGSGDGGACAIHPLNGNIQYATSQFFGDIFRTLDGWDSKQKIASTSTFGSDFIAFIAPIALSPNDARLLYAGTNFLNLNIITPLGSVWKKHLGKTKLAHDLLNADGSIKIKGKLTSIAIAPSDPARIYTGSNLGEMWMSKDAGQHWTEIDDGTTPFALVTGITVHPTVPNIIFATFSSTNVGHVWRGDNMDTVPAWHNISGSGATGLPDVPAHCIVLDPDEPTASYYVGTDVGMFYTTNFGIDWANATAPLGLPNVEVNDLQAIPGTRTLYAGTFGRGIWKIDMPDTLTPTYITASALIAGGASVKGEVGINGPAPGIGADVNLASSGPEATVPSQVTVPFGNLTTLFDVNTVPVTTTTKLTLSASRGGVTKTCKITVNPAVKSVTPVPATIAGGLGGQMRVLLEGPSLIDVSLGVSTDNPAVAQIVNASGNPISNFMIHGDPVTGDRGTVFYQTAPVTAATNVTLFARYGGIERSAVLKVVPPRPASVTFSPATVTAGGNSTGTVTLEAAPAVDTTVTLAVTAGSAAVKSIPASIVVAAGATTGTFLLKTKVVSSQTTVTVKATANGANLSGNLTVKPTPVPASVTFNPTSIFGGQTSTCRVTMSIAPTTNTIVTLKILSGANAVVPGTMPSSITVKAGNLFAEFIVQSASISTNTDVIIEATANGTSVDGDLLVIE